MVEAQDNMQDELKIEEKVEDQEEKKECTSINCENELRNQVVEAYWWYISFDESSFDDIATSLNELKALVGLHQ